MQATANDTNDSVDDDNKDIKPMAIQKSITKILEQHGISQVSLESDWELVLTNGPYPEMTLRKEQELITIFQTATLRGGKKIRDPEIAFAYVPGMEAWKPIEYKRQVRSIDGTYSQEVVTAATKEEGVWRISSIRGLKTFTNHQRQYNRQLTNECWTQKREVFVKNSYRESINVEAIAV